MYMVSTIPKEVEDDTTALYAAIEQGLLNGENAIVTECNLKEDTLTPQHISTYLQHTNFYKSYIEKCVQFLNHTLDMYIVYKTIYKNTSCDFISPDVKSFISIFLNRVINELDSYILIAWRVYCGRTLHPLTDGFQMMEHDDVIEYMKAIGWLK